MLSTAGLRAATFNFSVGRAGGGFWEFESFIRILMHRWEWVDWRILLEDLSAYRSFDALAYACIYDSILQTLIFGNNVRM